MTEEGIERKIDDIHEDITQNKKIEESTIKLKVLKLLLLMKDIELKEKQKRTAKSKDNAFIAALYESRKSIPANIISQNK